VVRRLFIIIFILPFAPADILQLLNTTLTEPKTVRLSISDYLFAQLTLYFFYRRRQSLMETRMWPWLKPLQRKRCVLDLFYHFFRLRMVRSADGTREKDPCTKERFDEQSRSEQNNPLFIITHTHFSHPTDEKETKELRVCQ